MARNPKLTLCGPEDSPYSSFLARFLTSRRARGVVPGTLHNYEVHLTIYLRWLIAHDEFPWDDAGSIDLYLADQRALGLKDPTIQGRYRALCIWFAWLKRRKLIADNPMEMIDAPTVKQEPIQHMTLAEYQQLISSIRGQEWIDKRDRVLLYVIFWCGLRIAEACALRQSDIDPSAKIVTVRRGKGGDGRPVPCGEDLYPAVLDYVWSRPPTTLTGQALDWLFVGSDGGGNVRGKLTPGGAAMMMKRRCREAGMRPISPHKGRHGLAMEMLNGGLEMSAVSKVLGHSNQKTTADFYAKWITGPLSAKYTEVRDKLLSPKPAK
jgi:site-specific recombinase XerD